MAYNSRLVGRDEIPEVLDELAAWESPGASGNLHRGDVGWFLRQPDAEVDSSLYVWGNGPNATGARCAVGLLESPTELRVAVPPDRRSHEAEVVAPEGWRPADESWGPVFYRPCGDDPDRTPDTRALELHDDQDIADRVFVQRNSFQSSTFTVDAWRRMATGPSSGAYLRSADLLLRNENGDPVAAATGWLSRPGACGLLEPVATLPEHRGRGHARAIVLAVCRALAAAGASGVRVTTNPANVAALALYESSGFQRVGQTRGFVREPATHHQIPTLEGRS